MASHPPKLTLAISCPSIYPQILGAEGSNPSLFCMWGDEGRLRFMALVWTPPSAMVGQEVMMEGGCCFLFGSSCPLGHADLGRPGFPGAQDSFKGVLGQN